MRSARVFCVLFVACVISLPLISNVSSAESADPVRFTHATIEVPTYLFGRAETVAPLFRSAESGGLYPYTGMDRDSLSRTPEPVKYEALTLENEYVRVVFLPELGGRIWQAVDKTSGHEIFYRTKNIKPTRYNQRSAWPVGGLELYGPYDAHMLTWPGEPWAWVSKEYPDGSRSVILTHVEHFFRNKVSLEVRLRPGRSFLETTIHLRNESILPNRYLLWTNAGLPATEGTRFVYPMTKTIGHDSANLGTWPEMNGVDFSWYKNNKNMLGVFGLDLYDNFIAGYDYTGDYGTVCFTDRRIARGVKTWTWGTGPAAMRHMASYSDGEGPYIEVQSGRFVWDGNYEFIDPGTTDGWTEYWYGAGGLGGLTTATKDLAVSIEPAKGAGGPTIAITPTGNFPKSQVIVRSETDRVWSGTADLKVGEVFRIPLPQLEPKDPIHLRVAGRLFFEYTWYPVSSHPESVFAKDAIPRNFGPLASLTVEETFQKGLGHEKFGQIQEARSAYEAALQKDPGYSPAHLQLGLLELERMNHDAAIEHFEKVLERDPVNGDAHYYLGFARLERGQCADARRHFYRLLPSSGKYARREYGVALTEVREGDSALALEHLDHALEQNPGDLSARTAKAFSLRKFTRTTESERECEKILADDPTNTFAWSERWFALAGDRQLIDLKRDEPSAQQILQSLDAACAHHPQGYLELATEYMRLAAWPEAERIALLGIEQAEADGQQPYPLLYYYRAYAAAQSHPSEEERKALQTIPRQDLAMQIFPFRREDITVLTGVLQIEPADANAATLLGDILYSKGRRTEALASWRAAVKADPKHFFALRDLGMALMDQGEADEALALLTRASEARPEHTGTTMLVARLNGRRGNAEAARQTFQRALDKNPGQDLMIENLAAVEAQMGNARKALELLDTHTFDPRHQSYSLLRLYQAVQLMLAGDEIKAGKLASGLDHLKRANKPAGNLGVDDFVALQSSRLLVFQALLETQGGGDATASLKSWQAAAQTRDDDAEGEGLFRAIALARTGQGEQAGKWFTEFERVNEQRKNDNSTELRTQAHYLAGIYFAFLGQEDKAAAEFKRSLEIDQSYLFAKQALDWLQSGLLKGLRE